MQYSRTKIIFTVSAIVLTLLMGMATNAQTESGEIKIITIKNAQISGINDNMITVVYTEGKRKVYDPITLTEETKIYSGKKLVTVKNLRLKQYLTITGARRDYEIIAKKISIGWVASTKNVAKTKIPVKSALKKTK